MKAKWVVGLLVVVVAAVLAWRLLPGLRVHVKDAYRKHGGWTEKARLDDPLGFLDYAEGRLEKHLSELQRGRVNIKEGIQRIDAEGERNRTLLAKSQELAAEFRQAFRSAEAGGSYPVSAAGSDYSRTELIEQVRLVLLQRDNYEDAIASLLKAGKAAEEADGKLLRQVTDTQAALAALPAKKEIVRVNQLAENVQELVAQIDALIYENDAVLEDQPVRTVEEIMAGAKPVDTDDVNVMAFLEGGE